MSARKGRPAWGAGLCAALLAAGCNFAPAPRPVATEYDLGLVGPVQPPERSLREPILVTEVAAPPRLDTSAMLYRLAYRDAAQLRAYADSRWAAPPAALLSARLRAHFAEADAAGVLTPHDAARAPLALRVELQELSQVFETPARSVVLLELRATLLHDHRVRAQRVFTERLPAATPDAAGGAAAFAAASDKAIAAIVAWTAANAER